MEPVTGGKTAGLTRDSGELVLTDGTLTLRADLSRIERRIAGGRWRHELLIKAARPKPVPGGTLSAVDMTAGLGEDSFLLAAAGYRVELCERDPVIFALLEDALRRAALMPSLSEAASRMHASCADSREVLSRLETRPDLIYLDPMFPERKKSALTKKKFQLLHQLESPCSDEEASLLLQAARAARPGRIIIKRPPKGPCLAGVTPSWSVTGKTVRYDCIG